MDYFRQFIQLHRKWFLECSFSNGRIHFPPQDVETDDSVKPK